MDTHIHEQLCVIEHRVEALLREVATGGREVAVPHLQGGVKGLQMTFDLQYLAHLESRHPEKINKEFNRATLQKYVNIISKYILLYMYTMYMYMLVASLRIYKYCNLMSEEIKIMCKSYIAYIIEYVSSCLHPAAVSDIEGDEGGVVAIGTEIVDTLV